MRPWGCLATLATVCLLVAGRAAGHSPVFDCFNGEDGQIICEGGFSDGTSAAGVRVRVLDASEKVLLEGKIDADGRFTFKKPPVEFHLVFDAGAGHTVTLFGADIS